MNRDAHYYAVLAFCRACGFKKNYAKTVAHASQFVDDAKINLMYIRNPCSQLELDYVNQQPAFFNMATCHAYFHIKTFNYEAMVNNTSPFHFVPGCSGENFTKKLRCKEESPVILNILNDVFQEDDLIKLGMVLHVYADSFSHQGFSGILSKVNDIKSCKVKNKVEFGLLKKLLIIFEKVTPKKYERILDSLLPAYGHSQALEFPDLPYLVWSYEYDYSDEFNGSYKVIEVDNKERYRHAFSNIKSYLEAYLMKYKQYFDNDVKFKNFPLLFETLVQEGSNKIRERNWQETFIRQGLFSLEEVNSAIYDENEWLKTAFKNFNHKLFNNRELEEVQLADDFLDSHWYRFYLAVKWYKTKFYKYCSNYGLVIPN